MMSDSAGFSFSSSQGQSLSLSMQGASISERGDKEEFDIEAAERKIQDHIATQYKIRMQINGTVMGTDVNDILSTMGLQTEAEDIRPLLPEWNNVSPQACNDAINTIRLTQNADIRMISESVEASIVRLGLFDWLKFKNPCGAKDPTMTYKTVKLSIQIAPRHMLFISTGFVLMITGGAILTLMSILWLAQANDREKVQLSNFHLLLSSFTQSFEQYFLEVHAETMVDQVDTLAKMIERQQSFREERIQQELKDEAVLVAQLLNAIGSSMDSGVTATGEGLLQALFDVTTVGASAAALQLSDLLAIISGWNADPALNEWESVAKDHTSGNMLVGSRQLNCAYGPCEYNLVECLRPTVSSTAPQIFSSTQDVHRQDVTAVALSIPRFNMTVCVSMARTGVIARRTAALLEAVAEYNEVYKERYLFRTEILLGAPVTGKAKAQYVSAPLRKYHPCYDSETCLGVDSMVRTVGFTKQPSQTRALSYSGDVLIIGGAPTDYDVVVIVDMREEAFLEKIRLEIVDVVNYLNFNSDRSTELSVGRKDADTGVITAQVNKFRFEDTCHGVCQRYPASSRSAKEALETHRTGWQITPDYRPEPVVGAYSYVGNRIDLAIIIERDVIEIRGIGLDALVSIFNDNNHKYTGTLEAQFVRFRGMPPMRVFDRHDRCDDIRDCVRSEETGVVYRSDCEHCTRSPEPPVTDLEILTELKMLGECQRYRGNCSHEHMYGLGGAERFSLHAGEEGSVHTTTDYRNENVLAVVSFVKNFSAGLVVKLDTAEIDKPIQSMIAQAVGAAIGIVLFGLAVLIFFSRKVLDKIELEWLSYKEQIDAEKKKFDNMVKDVIPRCIADEVSKGQKQAATMPFLSFVFLDICSLSDRTKSWSPEIICRYLTYFFTVVETVANHYTLNKVRIFGDTYFGVAGLGDLPTDMHCSLRVARFGAVIVQLLQRKFAHYPDRIPLIETTFKEVVAKNGTSFPDCIGNPADVGDVVMPEVRLGMHYGAGTFCIIETGRTPTYEIFGPGVALAARLQATSQPNRMHISGAMKEALEKVDYDRSVDYESARKTVVKGQGTVTSYFIQSVSVPIPMQILDDLGVEYANLRVQYEDQLENNHVKKKKDESPR